MTTNKIVNLFLVFSMKILEFVQGAASTQKRTKQKGIDWISSFMEILGEILPEFHNSQTVRKDTIYQRGRKMRMLVFGQKKEKDNFKNQPALFFSKCSASKAVI